MRCAYAITVRSQPDRHEDYGRALELVAFSPGVRSARVVADTGDSITIGYDGRECPDMSSGFRHALEVDGLVADGPLWELRAKPDADNPDVFHPYWLRRRYGDLSMA